MQGNLLYSTLVLFALLLVADTCRSAGAKPAVLADEEEAKRGISKGEKGEAATAKEEQGGRKEDEGEKEGRSSQDNKEETNTLPGAGLRVIRMSASAPYVQNPNLPEDEKKQRELAQRVRELLSRLPIIPLSQTPTLHKEILVTSPLSPAAASLGSAAAVGPQDPAPPQGSADDAAGGAAGDIACDAAVAPAGPPRTDARSSPPAPLLDSSATTGRQSVDAPPFAPAASALAALIATPLLFDKSSFTDDVPKEPTGKIVPSAITPLHEGGTAPPPPAKPTDNRIRYWPLPRAQRFAEAAEKGHASHVLRDIQVHAGSPEVERGLSLANALNTVGRWLERMKQELTSGSSFLVDLGDDETVDDEEEESPRRPLPPFRRQE